MASAYTLVVNIIAKKVIIDDESASDGNSLDLEGKKLHDLEKWLILKADLQHFSVVK